MQKLTLVFLCTVVSCSGLSLFYRGRTRNGLVPPPPGLRADRNMVQDQWFTQKLDHFNKADVRTWQQRFQVNDTFHQPGGPVFVMIGGEGEASAKWVTEETQWILWGKRFNALCIQLEHRYYGQSHPTDDTSDDNLKYLSSDQALADLAWFRVSIAEKYGLEDAKWIAFGGSYSGSLAAWLRMKYPHLFYAAVATSAPLLALVNFDQYNVVVRDSLATTGPTCNAVLELGVSQIGEQLKAENGTAVLKKLFRLCDDIDVTDTKEVMNLYATVAGVYQDVVQYNKDNRGFGAAPLNITIDLVCGILNDESYGSPLYRMAEVNSVYLDAHEEKCADFSYKKMIKALQETSWNSSAAEGGRQWTYQTCTEYGFYQSTDSPNQPFGNNFPVGFYIDQCADIFGEAYNLELLQSAINETNERYGELAIKVSRVVFPNGSIDPWHALGVLSDLSDEAIAIYINGTAHCADMYPTSARDSADLVDARTKIGDHLEMWLSETKKI